MNSPVVTNCREIFLTDCVRIFESHRFIRKRNIHDASIICHKQSAVAKGIVKKESIRQQRFHADRLTGCGGGFHDSLLMMLGTFTGLDTGIQIGIAYVNGIRVVQLVAIHTTFTLPHGLG